MSPAVRRGGASHFVGWIIAAIPDGFSKASVLKRPGRVVTDPDLVKSVITLDDLPQVFNILR